MTTIKGVENWSTTKSKLKQKFAVLTESDLMFADDKKDEMIGRLQVKLGKSKEEMQKIISAL